MISKKRAEEILKTYEIAWVRQDIPTVLSIFTKNGIYHERVLKKPFRGHKEIAAYWKTKVCEEQSNIKFKLLNYYIIKDTIIAEWDASFNSNIEKVRIHIKEVVILETKNGLISSLREYWQSEKFALR